MRRFLILSSALLATAASALSPTAVPEPPPRTWTVDLTGTLSSEVKNEIDLLGNKVWDEGRGQLAVVLVKTTGKMDPREYAVQVFDHLGIGSRERNDGMLLFVALEDRAAEIILGSGVDDAECAVGSSTVMQSRVVPNFKAGRPDRAALEGARGLADLLGSHHAHRDAPPTSAMSTARGPAPKNKAPAERPKWKTPRPHGWVVRMDHTLDAPLERKLNQLADGIYSEGLGRIFFVSFDPALRNIKAHELARMAIEDFGLDARRDAIVVGAPVGNTDLALILPERIVHRQWWTDDLEESMRAFQVPGQTGEGLMRVAETIGELARNPAKGPAVGRKLANAASAHSGWAFLFLSATLGAGGFGGTILWRRRPRRCEKCNNPRLLLSEQADDVHLSKGQRKEEELGSVNYHVWYCECCRDALSLRYGSFFTTARQCNQCNFKTLKETTTTTRAATYDHGGTVRVDLSCKHCKWGTTTERHTPKLVRQFTSSSSSGSSFSSSSGSSFGGGRSSGGGSSGRW